MSGAFNGYHTWLGIPPEEQPPNHYRLLGIAPFESDPAVIENAADRQTAHLRTLATSKHGVEAQRLLNEVSAARLCLLTDKKAAYDRELRSALAATSPAAGDPLLTINSDDALPMHAAVRRASGPPAWLILAFAGIGVLAAGLIVVAILSNTPNDKSITAQVPPPTAPQVERIGSQPPPPPPPPSAIVPSVSAEQPTATSDLSAPETPPETPPAVDNTNPTPEPTPITSANAPTETSEPPLPEPARTGLSQAGVLLVNFKGEVELFVNARQLPIENSQPVRIKLSTGDVFVVRMRAPWVYRGLRMTFVADDGGSVASFKRSDFRLVDGLEIGTIDAKAVQAGTEEPIRGRPDPEHQEQWDAMGLPSDVSEWFWGPEKSTWYQYGSVVSSGMFRTIDAQASLAYLQQRLTDPTAEPLTFTDISEPIPPRQRHAPPTDEERIAVEKQIREIFADDITAAKKTTAKVSLAQKILRQAKDPSNGPPTRYVLLQMACNAAAEGSDPSLASQIVDELEVTFEVDGVGLRVEAFETVLAKSSLTAVHSQVARQAATAADEAADRNDYDSAVKLMRTALAAARKARDAKQQREITERGRELNALSQLYKQVQAAQETLTKDANDPAANLLIGRWLWFSKDDVTAAMPHLAEGSDAALKQAAEGELAMGSTVTSEAQLALADRWADLARERPKGVERKYVLQRARYWFGNVARDGAGLDKVRAQQRLKDIDAQLSANEK